MMFLQSQRRNYGNGSNCKQVIPQQEQPGHSKNHREQPRASSTALATPTWDIPMRVAMGFHESGSSMWASTWAHRPWWSSEEDVYRFGEWEEATLALRTMWSGRMGEGSGLGCCDWLGGGWPPKEFSFSRGGLEDFFQLQWREFIQPFFFCELIYAANVI